MLVSKLSHDEAHYVYVNVVCWDIWTWSQEVVYQGSLNEETVESLLVELRTHDI